MNQGCRKFFTCMNSDDPTTLGTGPHDDPALQRRRLGRPVQPLAQGHSACIRHLGSEPGCVVPPLYRSGILKMFELPDQ